MGGSEPIGGASHGMKVASIVGATGNNSNCGVGIAPEVTFSSCSSVYAPSIPELLTYKLDQMDISQNSWAVEGCGENSRHDPNRRRRMSRRTNRNLQVGGVTAAAANETALPEFDDKCPFVHMPFDGYSLSYVYYSSCGHL